MRALMSIYGAVHGVVHLPDIFANQSGKNEKKQLHVAIIKFIKLGSVINFIKTPHNENKICICRTKMS